MSLDPSPLKSSRAWGSLDTSITGLALHGEVGTMGIWEAGLSGVSGHFKFGRNDTLLVKGCQPCDLQRDGLMLGKHSLLLTADGTFLSHPNLAHCSIGAEWRVRSRACLWSLNAAVTSGARLFSFSRKTYV